ncbi:helix-turn-helix domain-containing protein [Desulfonema magnum]|uniref:Homeodomain fold-containing protein n=1 Tax=Desulfonema magnum TaxID=45655 RepID=A0A975GNP5_9BACT|nr:helix-turn-helix domain-containing protein [Desulfonema magnum]QTA88181.1 Homeodomain fold-containing protein [Desulfonema magnum]
MAKRYIVSLTDEEKDELIALTKKGKTGARKINRAHILLLADECRTDKEIAVILRTGVSTVERIRKRFVGGGPEKALNDDPRNGAPRILSGRDEAVLIAEACNEAPEGRVRRTMMLLADRVVELGLADSISDETVRMILKNSDVKPWQKKQWCIPTVGPEYVFHLPLIIYLVGHYKYAAPPGLGRGMQTCYKYAALTGLGRPSPKSVIIR